MKSVLFIIFLLSVIVYCVLKVLFAQRPVSKQSSESIGNPNILPEDCIYKKCFEYNEYDLFKASRVPSRLKDMNLTNPDVRGYNSDDYWLKDNANKIGEDMYALGYLSHYGYIEQTFFSGYKNPEQDISFQSRIISLYDDGNGYYRKNFPNLICGFLTRWDFAQEIKNIIFEDKRFEAVKRTYELFRDIETGKLKHYH